MGFRMVARGDIVFRTMAARLDIEQHQAGARGGEGLGKGLACALCCTGNERRLTGQPCRYEPSR